MISISDGDMEVYQSGSVLHYADKPLEFTFKDDVTGKRLMSFKFIFTADNSKGENVSEFEIPNSTTMMIRLINFDPTGMGAGPKSPLSVGTLSDRQMYLGYMVYGGTDPYGRRLVQYTWYLGEAVSK